MRVNVLPNTHVILKYNGIQNLVLINKDISIGITWEFLHCSDLIIILITLVVMDLSYLCVLHYTQQTQTTKHNLPLKTPI
jgi:hypothetical protein